MTGSGNRSDANLFRSRNTIVGCYFRVMPVSTPYLHALAPYGSIARIHNANLD